MTARAHNLALTAWAVVLGGAGAFLANGWGLLG